MVHVFRVLLKDSQEWCEKEGIHDWQAARRATYGSARSKLREKQKDEGEGSEPQATIGPPKRREKSYPEGDREVDAGNGWNNPALKTHDASTVQPQEENDAK